MSPQQKQNNEPLKSVEEKQIEQTETLAELEKKMKLLEQAISSSNNPDGFKDKLKIVEKNYSAKLFQEFTKASNDPDAQNIIRSKMESFQDNKFLTPKAKEAMQAEEDVPLMGGDRDTLLAARQDKRPKDKINDNWSEGAGSDKVLRRGVF